MKIHWFLPLFLCSPAWIEAAPEVPAGSGAQASVVARVGSVDVTLEEVKAALEKLDARQQEAIGRDPALLNQVVRLLLVQRLVLNEAKGKKWDEQGSVKLAVERARESAIAESYLQSVANPAAGYPSEVELQAAYEVAKPSLVVGKQWKLAQIYIAAPEGASKESLEKAAAKLGEVKKAVVVKGADFAALARKYSDEPNSAGQGGEIGWMLEAQVQPEIREVATALAAGAQSEAVRMKDGWHFLKCLEVKEATTPPLEQVRVALTQRLQQEQAQAKRQAYLASLLEKSPVAINEVTLSKALVK